MQMAERDTNQEALRDKDVLKIGGLTMPRCTVEGWDVGIRLHADGKISVGVNLPKA